MAYAWEEGSQGMSRMRRKVNCAAGADQRNALPLKIRLRTHCLRSNLVQFFNCRILTSRYSYT